ncbi:tailspike protein [Acinetobacter virus fBenAci003]|uniref:Tailspike protein n=1 Tax=Acinetobacter virus fBenAci003 TaxID=2781370 RepID=A0A7S6U2N1_9CAUD|nr:tailspike protein [Acinetobacter virus fBenAci003]
MNILRSFTETVVTTPTDTFPISFEYDEKYDAVHVFLNDVAVEDLGYTVSQVNAVTLKVEPAIPEGMVRIERETDIDKMKYIFDAGALFIDQNVDADFRQIVHSQQEVRDGFIRLRGDVLPLVNGLQEALKQAQEASQAAQEAATAAEEAAQVTRSASQVNDASGETQQQVNDKVTNKTYFIVTPEMFGAKGFPHDDTAALQAALNFISPTQWDTSVAVMNQKGGGGKLILPKKYRITDTLWVGAYTTIEGMGKLGFNSSLLENVSAIVTDFTDPLKPAMSSSNWKTGGVRVAYDEQTTGAMYDNGLISATNGIKANGFSLLTKSGTRCFIGFRLQNSAQSEVNIYANGFDYGIIANASWESEINSRCLSYKCGLLINFDNNNLVFDGYYNALDGNVISGSTNLITFFTPDTGTDTALNGANVKFGVINRYSFGASSNSLIAEHNDVGCAVCQGDVNFQTLYTENNKMLGFVSFTNPSKTVIGNFVGHKDAYVCLLGANSRIEIVASNKTGTPQGQYFKSVNVYNSVLTVPLTLNEYVQGIRYTGYENILYVSSSGNNLNSGVVDVSPLATIDEAISRITKLSRFSNSNLKLDNRVRTQIVLLTDGDFNINAIHELYCDIDIVSIASSAPTLKFNGGRVVLNNSRVSVSSCNVLKDATVGTMENAAFWSRNGSNAVSIHGGNTNIQGGGIVYCDYNGASDITLTLNNVSVIGTSQSQLVQGNYLNTSPHIVNVVRSLGSISANITGRADKGISVPVAWQNKILGL